VSEYQKIDLGRVKRYSIKDRTDKVAVELFGTPLDAAGRRGMAVFLDSLPKFLKANDLRSLVGRCANAVLAKRRVILMSGAHTLKVGLSPLLIDFLEYYPNVHFATNGAGLIHDIEIAFFGSTSEDVEDNLRDGSFGMARETAQLFAAVASIADEMDLGLGEASGVLVDRENAPYREHCVTLNWYRSGSPYTVHASIGTDIVCQHPEYDGGKVGKASHTDFKLLCHSVSEIKDGGVVINIGSAVVMPEVFLKALSVARNLDGSLSGFTTANFDMNRHYRPSMNVVRRPQVLGAEGFEFIGHHELMIPLFLAAVKERAEAGIGDSGVR
jgi:hypothetical protein